MGRPRRPGGRAIGEDDVRQAGAVLQRGNHCLQSGGGRDQDFRAAVAQDVAHLVALQNRIHRHERATRCRGPEHRGDGLQRLWQVDGNAIVTGKAALEETARGAADRRLEFSVGPGA